MAPETINSAVKQIQKAKNILVVFKNDFLGDSLSAALALTAALHKKGATAQAVSGDKISEKFSFLPFYENLQNEYKNDESVVVEIANARDKAEEFWYETEGNNIKVFIAPKVGQTFKRDQVKTFLSGPLPELVVTIGTASLESLGTLFSDNTELFYKTPVVNIDVSSENSGYGSVNLIDLTATSNSEIVYKLLEAIGGDLIDDQVATIILSGLIAKIDSFQSVKTTPEAFFVAAELLEKGGDLQSIVKHLYKTKTFSLLKLWGRALSRLKMVPQAGLVISTIDQKDLAEADALEENIREVVEEMISALSDARMILFLAEVSSQNVQGYLYAKPQINLDDLDYEFKAQKVAPQLSFFKFSGLSLEQAQEEAKEKIMNWLESVKHAL